jgi:DNA replication and repair protein RecF
MSTPSSLRLKEIRLFNFKKHASLWLPLGDRFTCFLGPNGSGKTNVLDAIHYLCLTKSYFHHTDQYSITSGEQECSIKGICAEGPLPVSLQCVWRKTGKKSFKKNEKEYAKLSEHLGFMPQDSVLITEGSEERRKWMDATLCQTDPGYLQDLLKYNHLLLQRNTLLKQWGMRTSPELVEPYDYLLVQLGNHLFVKRQAFIQALTPLFQTVLSTLSQEAEKGELRLESDLNEGPFETLLKEKLERDKQLERTGVGIHRDDVSFLFNGMSVKKFASQGQQKSFLLALKLAQLQYIQDACRRSPLLLLDDVYDKLDANRVALLLEWIHHHVNGQVFITDTHLNRIPDALEHMHLPFVSHPFPINQHD